jgi:hypothetical protein
LRWRLLDALHGARQARRLERLEHVVDGAFFKGLHRIAIVCGDEHDVRALAAQACHFNARQAGHLHVEEQQVGPVTLAACSR